MNELEDIKEHLLDNVDDLVLLRKWHPNDMTSLLFKIEDLKRVFDDYELAVELANKTS